jgi:hypothetical protein
MNLDEALEKYKEYNRLSKEMDDLEKRKEQTREVRRIVALRIKEYFNLGRTASDEEALNAVVNALGAREIDRSMETPL